MVTRSLTAGEITLARRVFGDAIAYDKVTISDGRFIPLQPKGTGMAPNGHIYMYGCYHTDYAVTGPMTQSHFIHEMVHVWQLQNRILDPIADFFKLSLKYRFDYAASYRYTLKADCDLLDYNMEQQATIVQDYFLRSICGHNRDTGRCQNNDVALLQGVLARFLADPGYAKKLPPPTGDKPPAPPTA